MSTELINRITVKKDGVYVSSHSSNDTSPYHSLILSRLVDTFSSRILYPMLLLSGNHSIAVV